MKLPKQVPAVERKVNKEVSVPTGGGVHPSLWGIKMPSLDDIAGGIGDAIKIGQTVAPLIASM